VLKLNAACKNDVELSMLVLLVHPVDKCLAAFTSLSLYQTYTTRTCRPIGTWSETQ